MTVRFDSDTSRLRLDRDTFDVLVDHVTGKEADGSGVTALREAGVLRGDSVAPGLADGLDAVTAAICRLELTTVDRKGRVERGEGWVAGHAAALLLDLPDGPDGPWCEFITLHPTFLPEMLARISELGPRPRPSRAVPLQLPATGLADLLSPDADRRAAAMAKVTGPAPGSDVTAAATAIADDFTRRWSVTTRWPATGDTAGHRHLDVVDTTHGLWRVEAENGTVAIWPTTPTAIWHALVLLLPRDADLE